MERPDAPASRWRRARSRLLRPMVVVSLLVHALLLALLFVLPPEAPHSPPAPESSFDIVLDGGVPKPATPGQNAAPPAATPGVETPVPGPEPTPQPPPMPAPEPAPTPEPAPPPPAPDAPAPTPPAPEMPAPTPPAPAVPAPETPPAPEPPRVELPPPELPEPVPLPLPPPPPPRQPAPPRPRQFARPQFRPAPPRNPSGFPAPQDWSFSGGTAASRPSQQGASGQSLMAGPSLPAPRITGAELGRDWIAAYSAWVQSHLYYPEQAALNGEDGTTEVVINIDRTGKVLAVELVTRSGSQWLDLSTTGMFRGARVPPFPQNTKEDTATIDQTIHYVLTHRR